MAGGGGDEVVVEEPEPWAEAGLNEGLVSYWSMRNSGTTVYDEYGTNDGTAVNSPTFNEVNGVRDDGASVDRDAGRYIAVSNTMIDVADIWTVTTWFRATAIGTSQQAITAWGRSSTITPIVFLGVCYTTTDKLRMQYRTDTNVNHYADYNVNEDEWTHVALVKLSDKLQLYKNGTFLGDLSVSGAVTVDQFAIGAALRTSAGMGFNGSIDEVGIWDRALSASEIQDLYNTPLYAPYKE
jgi:hypothetical protein